MRYEHSLILVYFSSIWNILVPKNLTKSKQTNNLCENFCTTSDNLTQTAEHKQTTVKSQISKSHNTTNSNFSRNVRRQQTLLDRELNLYNSQIQHATLARLARLATSSPFLHPIIPHKHLISSHISSALPRPFLPHQPTG